LSQSAKVLIVSARLEEEAAVFDTAAGQKEYLGAYGLESTGLEKIILAANSLLHLQSYYTVGPQEARSWQCRIGITAPQAAGLIHSDFEKGFINTDVTKVPDFLQYKSEEACKVLDLSHSENYLYFRLH
jgi:ribosome-binding ATPase YchF (GTP1/OBG family)